MVDMRATNAKLRGRNLELLVQATGCSEAEAVRALDACSEAKTAVVHLLTGRPPQECRDRLAASGGRVRPALE
jgi:N-acetylmuramic acid 6-phosphate etherase